MSRTPILLAFSIAAATLLAGRPAAEVRDLTGCPNAIQSEPVLLVNVSGGTLLGQVHAHLAIYSSGLATYSEMQAPGLGLQPAARVEIAQIPHASLLELQRSLAQAGAWQLCDQLAMVTDVPLVTITLLRGATEASARTFSYWLPTGDYAAVHALVEGTLAAHFPAL